MFVGLHEIDSVEHMKLHIFVQICLLDCVEILYLLIDDIDNYFADYDKIETRLNICKLIYFENNLW